MMKLGILGAGMIVREFLPWLTGPESPFKVEALCSTERSAGAAQALCNQYGVPRHTTSYDELLSWVDVVYIAVPNILHVKYNPCRSGSGPPRHRRKADGPHGGAGRRAGRAGPEQKALPL